MMRRMGICEERGSGVDKVVFQTEFYQLPAPMFEVTGETTRAVLFAHRPLSKMDKADRIRACYLHACLKYVNREYLTNTSLRERFGIKPKFEVIHVVNLYARWIREGRFKLDPSKNPDLCTLHDPCNAARKSKLAGFPDIMDDARYVMDAVCTKWVESWPNRENNICCSGGGGALISGFKNARMAYGKIKVEQIDRTGAKLVCTPCVNCYDGIGDLAAEYKRPWKPIHLWRLLANAIVV